jgi:fumarate hydratase subunit alpha/L(+)-tartrate dehydratase alpha subunit
VKVDLAQVEEAAKQLYIRALKELPPDIKQGFERLAGADTRNAVHAGPAHLAPY